MIASLEGWPGLFGEVTTAAAESLDVVDELTGATAADCVTGADVALVLGAAVTFWVRWARTTAGGVEVAPPTGATTGRLAVVDGELAEVTTEVGPVEVDGVGVGDPGGRELMMTLVVEAVIGVVGVVLPVPVGEVGVVLTVPVALPVSVAVPVLVAVPEDVLVPEVGVAVGCG